MTARKAKKKMKQIQANQTYADYLQKYERRRETMAKQGLRMVMKKYTKDEWERQKYLADKETNVIDVNSLLVDRATFERSEKQAAAYKRALEEKGVKATRRELMLGSNYRMENYLDRLLDDISIYNAELAAEGRTGTERKAIIGAMYFGSI